MLGWVIGDRFEKRLVAAACMLMHAAGLLMLTYATGSVDARGFARCCTAARWGLRGPFMQAMRADYFGRRSIGMIMGLSAMITRHRPDRRPAHRRCDSRTATGNYRVGFTLLALLAGVGSLFFYWAKAPESPE